jgi:hypothetical protein
MSNPDYDWRKRGADMQKLHPTGTPTAVAAAIAKVQESTYEQVPDVALPTPEETFAFLGKALAGLAQNMARDYWRISRNGPALSCGTRVSFCRRFSTSVRPTSLSA